MLNGIRAPTTLSLIENPLLTNVTLVNVDPSSVHVDSRSNGRDCRVYLADSVVYGC